MHLDNFIGFKTGTNLSMDVIKDNNKEENTYTFKGSGKPKTLHGIDNLKALTSNQQKLDNFRATDDGHFTYINEENGQLTACKISTIDDASWNISELEKSISDQEDREDSTKDNTSKEKKPLVLEDNTQLIPVCRVIGRSDNGINSYFADIYKKGGEEEEEAYVFISHSGNPYKNKDMSEKQITEIIDFLSKYKSHIHISINSSTAKYIDKHIDTLPNLTKNKIVILGDKSNISKFSEYYFNKIFNHVDNENIGLKKLSPKNTVMYLISPKNQDLKGVIQRINKGFNVDFVPKTKAKEIKKALGDKTIHKNKKYLVSEIIFSGESILNRIPQFTYDKKYIINKIELKQAIEKMSDKDIEKLFYALLLRTYSQVDDIMHREEGDLKILSELRTERILKLDIAIRNLSYFMEVCKNNKENFKSILDSHQNLINSVLHDIVVSIYQYAEERQEDLEDKSFDDKHHISKLDKRLSSPSPSLSFKDSIKSIKESLDTLSISCFTGQEGINNPSNEYLLHPLTLDILKDLLNTYANDVGAEVSGNVPTKMTLKNLDVKKEVFKNISQLN